MMIEIDAFLKELSPLTDGPGAPLKVRDFFERVIPQGVDIPARFTAPSGGGYARHLVARFPSGATAIAMVWDKGQGTPVHDHGMWCVEGVFAGKIAVVRYDLLEDRGAFVRLATGERLEATVGEAGALIPPTDYHTITNTLATPSVTIHIYAREMDRAKMFYPEEGDRYRMEEKTLAYTTCAPLLDR